MADSPLFKEHIMSLSKARLLPSLMLVCASLVSLAAAPPQDTPAPDWMAVVGPYPQPGTPTALAEVAILSWLQRTRTQADVSRALSEAHPSLGCFAAVLTPSSSLAASGHAAAGISLADYPMTQALLAQARTDLEPILAGLQNTFARPRPYVSFPALTPAIPAEAGPSYPSSHAVLGVVYARILSQFVPPDRNALLGVGALLGTDRVLAGVHWPSDVEAGQRLGQAFADYWINQPLNRQAIKDCCCHEWRQGH
jgi:membrane-associated phospholipid phosphatase